MSIRYNVLFTRAHLKKQELNTVARIAGVNIPVQKHTWSGLTHIYGIGRSRALEICATAGVKPPRSGKLGVSRAKVVWSNHNGVL